MRRFSQKCSLVALDQDDGIPGADGKTGIKPGRTGVGSGERKVAFIDEDRRVQDEAPGRQAYPTLTPPKKFLFIINALNVAQ